MGWVEKAEPKFPPVLLPMVKAGCSAVTLPLPPAPWLTPGSLPPGPSSPSTWAGEPGDGTHPQAVDSYEGAVARLGCDPVTLHVSYNVVFLGISNI